MLHYSNIGWCVFLYLLPKMFVLYFNSSWCKYLCEALIIYRITGEIGSKHVISAMQGDGMMTYIQHSKMCVQKIASQYDGISDW